MEYINNNMTEKSKLDEYSKQILDEINYCWDEKDKVDNKSEVKQISLENLIDIDKDMFLKNIKWVVYENEFYPYYYAVINNKVKILVNLPYEEINIKAYRNGDFNYKNQSLRVIN